MHIRIREVHVLNCLGMSCRNEEKQTSRGLVYRGALDTLWVIVDPDFIRSTRRDHLDLRYWIFMSLPSLYLNDNVEGVLV